MQDALGPVLFAVVGAAAVIAVLTFVGSRKLYDEIGRGAFAMRDEVPKPSPAPGSAAGIAERDSEIRQMLEARNHRRMRNGEAPVDVEDELRRLTAPAPDVALRAEVRQLVLARNERRARQGKPPLDVEAEIDRQLRDLLG